MLRPDIDVVLRPPTPAPARVLRRAWALAALACRAQLEPHLHDAEARAILAATRDWLATPGVGDELDDAERAVLAAPPGALDDDARAAAGWRGEGAAVLAWALSRAPLPDVATPVDAADVAQALDWLSDTPGAALESARLRARADLLQLAEQLQSAQWRLERQLRDEVGASLRAFAGPGVPAARDAAPLPLAPDGELLLDGLRTADAPPALVRRAHRIVVERRIAANWLAGQHPRYADVVP